MTTAIPASKLIAAGKDAYILVDGFQYASRAPSCTQFFLSHAHSDHYTGLKPDWSLGAIYCSNVTARLVTHLIGIDPSHLRPLPLHSTTTLPSGIRVTLIDANHCPGAVQFLFHFEDGRRIVHTGDFRFKESLLSCPHLEGFRGADTLYLDTTYCNQRYRFPKQEESVEYVVSIIESLIDTRAISGAHKHLDAVPASTSGPQLAWDRLFLISTYVIGKERILQAVARRCNLKIYINDRKAGVMACLGLPEDLFTTDPAASCVHVVPWNFLGETWPYFRPNWNTAREYALSLNFSTDVQLIGFVPTGWVHGMAKERFPVKSKDPSFVIHLVPYSEHSSYDELLAYVRHLRPTRVIPTVGAKDDKAVAKMLRHFTLLINQDAAKAEFISKIAGKSQTEVTLFAAGIENEVRCVENGDEGGSVEEPRSEHDCGNDGPKKSSPAEIGAVASASGDSPDTNLQILITVADGKLSIAEAVKLLAAASGDVSRAADMYFRGIWRRPIPTASAAVDSSQLRAAKRPRVSGGTQRSLLSFWKSPEVDAQPQKASCEKSSEPEQDFGRCRNRSVPGMPLHAVSPALGPGPELAAHRSMESGKETEKPSSSRTADVPRDAVALPLNQYDPVAHAIWSRGEPTPYLHLARAFEAMDSTTKRLRIGDILTNMFRSVLAVSPPEDLAATAYLAVGKIAPDYEGMELNIGGSTVAAAVSETTGRSRDKLRSMYVELGDLGDVAAACKRSQSTLKKPSPLTVSSVYQTLRALAVEKGQGAAGRRQRAVVGMLRACREAETKYLVRTLVQALRVGANWRSVVPSLAKAILMNNSPSGQMPLKADLDAAGAGATAAYHVCPNLSLLIDAMRSGPMNELSQRCRLTPGVPIKPMLAKISEGIDDSVKQLREASFLCEYKYDGMRAQIHVLENEEPLGFENGRRGDRCQRVKIFSRNCEDRSASFPDVTLQIMEVISLNNVSSCILDAEIVAVERRVISGNEKHPGLEVRIRPFQDLASRPRAVVDVTSITTDICIFVFDILERDGANLLSLSLRERRAALHDALRGCHPGYVALAQGHEVPNLGSEEDQDADATEDMVRKWLLEAFSAGTEGLMLKRLDAAYEPSRRSDHWIKLKRDYCEGLHDTLDLVVMGAWYGNGRKAGWLSPFLLGVWDPEREEIQSLCRCMSGFSDVFYRAATSRLKETVIKDKKPYYNSREFPDVWFDAKEVWEIRGADLTLSPVHRAAVGRVEGSDRGIGLRFPRFVRIREDKEVEEATTAEAVASMYHMQERKVGGRVQVEMEGREPDNDRGDADDHAGNEESSSRCSTDEGGSGDCCQFVLST